MSLSDMICPYCNQRLEEHEILTHSCANMFRTQKNHIPTKAPFVKDDKEKPMLSLIDPQFIISLGDILTFGAKKYSADNWKLCDDTSRYKDALLRHTFAYLGGEILDPESGIPHTACMAFNVMALQWFDNNLKGQDNE